MSFGLRARRGVKTLILGQDQISDSLLNSLANKGWRLFSIGSGKHPGELRVCFMQLKGAPTPPRNYNSAIFEAFMELK